MDRTEWLTRIELIDKALAEQGWHVNDPHQVKIEVDTIQSDFAAGKYICNKESLKDIGDHRYVDYVLVDDDNNPIAIIEAKRTSKDPILAAQTQAKQYYDDICQRTDKRPFIFLTNGYQIYFWNYGHAAPRVIKGFLSLKDLLKVKWQNENRQPLLTSGQHNFDVDPTIVNRDRVRGCIRKVIEHYDKGHRKALLVMATGTGKTRAAMAIIKILMQAKIVKRVLFIADRKELRSQAYARGFLEFFPSESKVELVSGNLGTEFNLYAATIQTMSECYREFSPGFFDLIISDESHRSIYVKWKDVFTYFDSYLLGLTATPRDCFDLDEMRDTFTFFDCADRTPTAYYSFSEAVKDGVLVDFKKHIHGAQAHYQIAGLKIEDLTESQIIELMRKGIDPETVNFEGSDFERKFVTTGTNEAIVREFMDYCQPDSSGTMPAKSIIFAMTKKHAKRLWEAFNKLYPEYRGELAKVITCEDSRAKESIKQFEEQDFPRVAISVDMLDTGIDVEEVCNLVFAKPVYSRIKFWQMLGRGTRCDAVCEHREWLPNGKKEYFMVFDFFKNFERFNVNPEGAQRDIGEALPVKVFCTRLDQLKSLHEGTRKYQSAIRDKIRQDIEKLPQDSVAIRDNLEKIHKALSPNFWDSLGLDHAEYLRKNLAPLMRFNVVGNTDEGSFNFRCERLALAILRRRSEDINALRDEICHMLQCLPDTIDEVKRKEIEINKALSPAFWKTISFDDVQWLLEEFSSLMKFKTSDPIVKVIVDLNDIIQVRGKVLFGDGQEEYAQAYQKKVEMKIRELSKEHPTIKKILNNEDLTPNDVEDLENALNNTELHFNEHVLGQFYRGTFLNFVRSVIGLFRAENAKTKVKEAFDTFIVQHNRLYNADQTDFIMAIQNYFVHNRHIEFADLLERPFTNFAESARPEEGDLQQLIQICQKLEAEI